MKLYSILPSLLLTATLTLTVTACEDADTIDYSASVSKPSGGITCRSNYSVRIADDSFFSYGGMRSRYLVVSRKSDMSDTIHVTGTADENDNYRTYYDLTGLQPGTTYYYAAGEYDGYGERLSGTSSFTTLDVQISITAIDSITPSGATVYVDLQNVPESLHLPDNAYDSYYEHSFFSYVYLYLLKNGKAHFIGRTVRQDETTFVGRIGTLAPDGDYQIMATLSAPDETTYTGKRYWVATSNAEPLHTPASEPAPAVDLGLSVMWAAWNVGATNTSDPGCYFLYGQPEGLWNGFSQTDYDICGVEGRDIALTHWGKGWRMPTQAEIQELLENCQVDYNSSDSRIYRLTSYNNGRSLQFPLSRYTRLTESAQGIYAVSGEAFDYESWLLSGERVNGQIAAYSLYNRYTSYLPDYTTEYDSDGNPFNWYYIFSVRPVYDPNLAE